MCRAKSVGGRRCPCDDPIRRSAQRKARRARRAADGLSSPAPDITMSKPARTYDPHELRALAETVSAAYGAQGTTVDDVRAARDILTREHGGAVQALIAIGNAVRDEGERRSGIDLSAARDELAAETEQIKEAAVAVQERMRLAVRQTRAAAENITGSFAERRQVLASGQRHHESTMRSGREELNELRARSAEIEERIRAARTGLADGYRSALADIREMGGRDLAFHESTKPAARKAFNEAANVYPSQWLDRSNESQAIYATITRSRAHYSRGAARTTRKMGNDIMRVSVTSLAEANEFASKYAGSAYYDATIVDERDDMRSGGIIVEVARYDVRWSASAEQKPKGRGWQLHTWTENGEECTVWRRPVRKTVQQMDEVTPEIRTNVTTPLVDGTSTTYAVATHELAHRMEHVLPQITHMESDFLAYRTTGADGSREQQTPIYGGRRGKNAEVGYEDSFALHYSGKTYGAQPGHDSGHHYELLSTGVEALFAGRHGSQAGLGHLDGQYSNDDEYRAFVLGVMATARA